MSQTLRIAALTAATLMTLLLAASAQAAPVTIGAPLTPSSETLTFGGTGTAFNEALSESGANVTSPISGTIVRWRLVNAVGPFRLRVLSPNGGTTYTAVSSSALVNGLGAGTETFATALPIQAGQTIGLDLTEGSKIGFFEDASEHNGVGSWSPPLAEGVPRSYGTPETGLELSFNADVQRPPSVSGIAPANGGAAGGSAVTITGSEFEGATAVKFGSIAAASYAVDSEGQITALAPAGTGAVPVSVTTPAGTATSAQAFAYVAPTVPAPTCTVPKLKGRSLKASKKSIRAADCKVGMIRKKEGATAKSAKVVKQSRKPGSVVPAGTKIVLTLKG